MTRSLPILVCIAFAIVSACGGDDDACGSDTDCKGDRICNAGACVDPEDDGGAGGHASSTGATGATGASSSDGPASSGAMSTTSTTGTGTTMHDPMCAAMADEWLECGWGTDWEYIASLCDMALAENHPCVPNFECQANLASCSDVEMCPDC